jgi:hypothetical protein
VGRAVIPVRVVLVASAVLVALAVPVVPVVMLPRPQVAVVRVPATTPA